MTEVKSSFLVDSFNVAQLLLCSHSPNDVAPVPQRNVSIAAERGAVRPSMMWLKLRSTLFIGINSLIMSG